MSNAFIGGLKGMGAEPADRRWIVVNIGCIECGVSSNIVGVFDDKARADALAEELEESHGWREGGQNRFEVFAMPEVNAVATEYTAPVPSREERGVLARETLESLLKRS